MQDYIVERTVKEAEYMIEHQDTVRDCAKIFGISKSTLHADLTIKLKQIDDVLYEQVRKILDYNFSVRHLRGGESTKQKYSKISD